MKVKIRHLQENDARTSVNWRNDPEIWKLTGSKPDRTISLDDEMAWIKKVIADDTSERFAILADGVYVGNIYLTDINSRSAEYHIFIGDKAFWGKGVAQAASRELLFYAKDTLGLSKVELNVNRNNAAAIHVYEKLGFEQISISGDNIKMELKI